MSIHRLPAHVVAPLQSSLAVPSLNAALCGLLCNALDADATTITLSVDYTRGSCSAEDDGLGIPSAEFSSQGGLAKLHHTSKYPSTSALHGRHGVLLASIAALAHLTVVSRRQGEPEQHALIIHNDRVRRRDQPATPEQRIVATTHGTRVVVQDLFGCMPVRARQRPASDMTAWRSAWDALVRAVAALLLAWPRHVAVVLRASGRTTTTTTTWTRGPSESCERTRHILVQASLCDRQSSWIPVASSGSGITIRGCIATTPSAAKHAQFLHIGIVPLAENHHADVLYQDINKLFAESQFGTEAGDKSGAVRRKAVDRWPMFSLGIDIDASAPVDVADLLDDRRQHLAVIRALLHTMLVQFLTRQGFYESRASPAKRRKTHSKQQRTRQFPFASWPRVKRPGKEPEPKCQLDQTRISRESLAAATVVGQVDQKFILVRAQDSLLVLIDQHAADERCRVEELFAGYFVETSSGWQACTTALEPPLQFELDAHEKLRLEALQGHFCHWGVVYRVLEGDDAVLLQVHRLPTSLAERCQHEQRLVIDLVRQEMWETSSVGPSQTDEESWVARFRGCPRGILDLLHSRACHSAIRFNDPLSTAACRDLLHRLQQCVFPFQCAHGRPSMVPCLTFDDLHTSC